MIRVSIIDQTGKSISPNDLSTAAELRDAAAKAKSLANDCERLALIKEPKPAPKKGGMPYMT